MKLVEENLKSAAFSNQNRRLSSVVTAENITGFPPAGEKLPAASFPETTHDSEQTDRHNVS